MYAFGMISFHLAVLMLADLPKTAASANVGAVVGHWPAIMRLKSLCKVRSWWFVWSGSSNDVHWWLTKSTLGMEDLYRTSLPSARSFWCGSSVVSSTKCEMCITHISACMSTAVEPLRAMRFASEWRRSCSFVRAALLLEEVKKLAKRPSTDGLLEPELAGRARFGMAP